jgi:hypothetical protein
MLATSLAALAAAGASAQRAGGPAPVVRDGQQAPESGTGLIGGVVVADDGAAQPLRRATVSLRNVDIGVSSLLLTDEAGRFAFGDLPGGRFTLSVQKPAYVSTPYGAKAPRSPGLTIALSDGEQIADLTIRMARGAVITGRVADEQGQPAIGLRVTAAERVMVNGEASYRPAFAGGARTDDRGAYRLYGIAAGSYVIAVSPPPAFTLGGAARVTTAEEVEWALSAASATPGSSQTGGPAAPPRGPGLRYTPVFYPGTTDAASAIPVSVTAGEERSSVDFVVQLVATATVEGSVTRADGAPVGRNVQVMALSASSVAIPGILELPPRATVAPDGRFNVSGLVPGRYALTARAASGDPAAGPGRGGRGAGGPPVMDLWATTELDIAGLDVADVALRLAPGMTVSGRVVVEAADGSAPDVDRASIRLQVPPSRGASFGVPVGQADADGTFRFVGVPPGAYYVTANLPGGTPAQPAWTLKSATLDGRNVADTVLDVRPNEDVAGIVVTFTDRVTQLSGSLTDRLGRPAPGYFVMAFPTNAALWRQQSRWLRPPTRPSTDGRFVINGLPPGEYHLAAITEFQPNEWYTPAFLQQLVPMSLSLTLGDGERRTQDVRLAAN